MREDQCALFFGPLVSLAFPPCKEALNALHGRDGMSCERQYTHPCPRRFWTASGMLLACADEESIGRLREREWRELFGNLGANSYHAIRHLLPGLLHSCRWQRSRVGIPRHWVQGYSMTHPSCVQRHASRSNAIANSAGVATMAPAPALSSSAREP